MSLVDRIGEAGAAALRRLDPEQAHRLAIKGLAFAPLPRPAADDPILRTTLAGLDLPNPVGLAAGLDKDGEALSGLSRLGFGFVECGSVTPRPQEGNPRPRLFRVPEHRAIINRMGFNNAGVDALVRNIDALDARPGIIGINIGKNKDTPNEEAARDYLHCLERIYPLADYVTVNISSPNTPGLRALQGREQLDDLLGRIEAARPPRDAPRAPVFLKVAPDLAAEEIGMIVEASLAHRIDGLIVSNTTLERPRTLRSPQAAETGGLSGAPIRPFAEKALRAAAEAADGRLPLIAVGGIDSGAEAYARIRLGASAVQLYSALIYEGPGLVARIKRDLAARLRADGFSTLSQAVGAAR